jgi:hypothetical protein
LKQRCPTKDMLQDQCNIFSSQTVVYLSFQSLTLKNDWTETFINLKVGHVKHWKQGIRCEIPVVFYHNKRHITKIVYLNQELRLFNGLFALKEFTLNFTVVCGIRKIRNDRRIRSDRSYVNSKVSCTLSEYLQYNLNGYKYIVSCFIRIKLF